MVALVCYDPAMDAYDFGPGHPLRPERVSLSVALMRACGLLAEGNAASGSRAAVVMPDPATRADLELVHDDSYVAAVERASASPRTFVPAHGLATGDDPVFAGMHEAAALVAGGTARAVKDVLSGRAERALAPAGGLHHAHRDRAAGFCVYNDAAVAIAAARRERPGLRVLYVDIDAHHGDGVQEAFYDTDEVCTVSLHESGRYLFPGTGFPEDAGVGKGVGFALNVPLPPGADDDCYALAFTEVVEPAARAFSPDLLVAQCGADAHHGDPLTHLGVTLPGFRALYRRIVTLAEETAGGRLVATGGGGYQWRSVVPRAWTLLLAELLGVELPGELPPAWRVLAEGSGGERVPAGLLEEKERMLTPAMRERLLEATRSSVAGLREHTALLG